MKKIFAVTGIALLLTSILCLFPVAPTTVHAASSVSHAKYTITYGKPRFVKGSMSAVVYGCNGLSCDGLDPHTTKCDQSSLKLVPIIMSDSQGVLATGNNVYSVGCNSNWTTADSMAARASSIYLTGEAVDSTGLAYYVCFPGNDKYLGCYTPSSSWYNGASGWPAWTDMIEGTNTYKACLGVNTINTGYNLRCESQ